MPTGRMGPPPGASPPMRMTASWSGSERTYRIQVCGAMFRARWRVPLGSLRRHVTRCRQTPELRGEASLAVHRPSVCSGVKALRNTSDAKAASRQAALAFRSPLTPSARSGNLIAGDGTKNGISRSEQRTVSKPKRTISGSTAQPRGKSPLTGKAPYKSGANLPPPIRRGGCATGATRYFACACSVAVGVA
jgi:hypothetical protein